jgi:hypothetical protein
VSKFHSNRRRNFGDLRFCTNEHLYFYLYRYAFFFRYIGSLGRMPHFSLLVLFLILTQSGIRRKYDYTIHRKIILDHTYIYPICLRYFGLLGSMAHCSLLILILTQWSKRAKLNCHIHRDIDYPGTYICSFCLRYFGLLGSMPHCRQYISIVTEPLPSYQHFLIFVSADMSHGPVAWQKPAWNIHFSSDISALWAECHIFSCLLSSLYYTIT